MNWISFALGFAAAWGLLVVLGIIILWYAAVDAEVTEDSP